jgi:RNA polymerase subunit RPABC4/transcription elongation factor Spt4
MYIGGGIFFAIIIGLIMLPLLQVGLWFPFTNADSSGSVNYRSSEILGFNEYWYEKEYIKGGNEITFSVQSSPGYVSFIIWDQPLENLPTTTRNGSYFDFFSLQYNEYQYYSVYLKSGSSIFYNFTVISGNPIDFFIADADQMEIWNLGGSPSFYKQIDNTPGSIGNLSISLERVYYLVWYNDGGSLSTVNFIVNFTAINVLNLDQANEYREPDVLISGSFIVPYDGTWYFFVYHDPLNSPEEFTDITFDVTYDTGLTYVDRWLDIQWILIFILVVIVIVIIIAFAARKGQKKMSLKAKKEQKAEPTKTTKAIKEEVKIEARKCPRCSFDIKHEANFCPKCGGKIEGRSMGSSEITTPAAEAKTCSFCGSKLSETSNFCPWCGTPKLKSNQSTIKKI